VGGWGGWDFPTCPLFYMELLFKFVPMFVEAKSRPELVQTMLELNIKDRVSYRFFDISFDPQKKMWVAWYYPTESSIQ
jgi:hypothetical protein